MFIFSVAKRNYYPLATVANKKKCLPLTQTCDPTILTSQDLSTKFQNEFPGFPFSSTNKTDLHDITEIFLIVALNTIQMFFYINGQFWLFIFCFFQFCDLNRLSHEVGWKYQKVVSTLEARRKVKSKKFYERKKSMEV